MLPAVEAYSTAKGSWSMAPSLGTARLGPVAVSAPDGRIYAIGGNSGGVTAEAYSPCSPSPAWVNVPAPPSTGLLLVAAVGPDGRIFFMDPMGNTISAYGPTNLALTTTQVPGGATVRLTGDNFAANATVNVYFGTMNAPVASGATGSNGSITGNIAFAVTAAPGTYPIKVVDDRSHYPITLSLTVP